MTIFYNVGRLSVTSDPRPLTRQNGYGFLRVIDPLKGLSSRRP